MARQLPIVCVVCLVSCLAACGIVRGCDEVTVDASVLRRDETLMPFLVEAREFGPITLDADSGRLVFEYSSEVGSPETLLARIEERAAAKGWRKVSQLPNRVTFREATGMLPLWVVDVSCEVAGRVEVARSRDYAPAEKRE